MLDVLLVYTEIPLREASFLARFPLGLFYLAAFLEKNGYRAGVWSGDASQWENFWQILERRNPRVVGFSVSFDNYFLVKDWCRTVKEHFPEKLLVVGGPQALAFDAEDLVESRADVVVLGEGELTLLELCQWFLEGYGDLSRIKGIRYLEGEHLQETPPRPLIKNLDALPFPRLEHALYPLKKTVYPVLTGRGCPFRCTFCYEGALKPKRYRSRSVSHLRAELEYVFSRHPVSYLVFVDDTFSLNRKRLQEIAHLLRDLRKKHDFVWFCEAHPRSVLAFQEEFSDLISLGLRRVQIGIESGDDRVLSFFRKKTSAAVIEETVRFLTSSTAGFCSVVGNFILGGPFENRASLKASFRFAERLLRLAPGKIDLHPVFLAFYPGTPISLCPEKFGLFPLRKDLKGKHVWISMHDVEAVTAELSRQDLEKAYRDLKQLLEDTALSLLDQIPLETIYQLFVLYFERGLMNYWLGLINRHRPAQWKYFEFMLSKKWDSLFFGSVEASSPEIAVRKPWRLYSLAELEEVCPGLDQEELAVFARATGKITVKEMAEDLRWPVAKVVEVLKALERQYLILWMPRFAAPPALKIERPKTGFFSKIDGKN